MRKTASSNVSLSGESVKYLFEYETAALCEVISTGGPTLSIGAQNGNWRLEIKTSDGENQDILPNDMALAPIANLASDRVQFVWLGSGGEKVIVEWRVEKDSLLGNLSYSGFDNDRKVEKIIFPIVEFDCQSDDKLLLPWGLGRIVSNFAKNEDAKVICKHLNVNYTMQFYAWLSQETSLYFDTRDSDAYIKEAEFFRINEETIRFTGSHLVPGDETSQREYQMPYESSLCPFQGDWHEAAAIYSEWARTQSWYLNSKARAKNKDIENIGLWVWNRGSFEDVSSPVFKLKEKLRLPVALDWYWWHRNPYDTEYPRYLPPREGTENFKAALSELNRRNIFTQVYINGVLLDMDDEEAWGDCGEKSAVILNDGSIRNHIFNRFMNRRLAFMCGDSSEFREKIVEIAKELRSLGLPGLYLDVISAHCNDPCYNSHHDHVSGGGCYQGRGFREMLSEIRAECPDYPLSSESCCEIFMDLLDSAIILDPSWERSTNGDQPFYDWEQIPLFKAVYGGALTMFGNYALLDGIPPYDELWPKEGKRVDEKNWRESCPDQFFLEMARTVIWGLQPTVANIRNEHLENLEFEDEIEFLNRVANFYYENRSHFLNGDMLPAGDLEVSNIPVSLLSRATFTPEGGEKIREKNLAAILHSRWINSDGKEILCLANYSSSTQNFKWTYKDKKHNGKIDAHSFLIINLS